jgi:hypothetical protein
MYYCIMVRLYYKLRYNEDTEAYELYDPHTTKSVAFGTTLAFLKVKVMDAFEYHPINEEDLIYLIDRNTIVFAHYDIVTETHENEGGKIVIGWNGEEYLKSLIQGRNIL